MNPTIFDALLHPVRAYGDPGVTGTIRTLPEDFQVDEDLGFELTGEGEHVCLHIRKRNTNTVEVASRIARLAGVKPMDVSYAGLKDRYAVTSQWFSIYLSNKTEPDWSALAGDEIEILTVTRHNRKLRRGALKGNRFQLVIRDVEGDWSGLDARINRIAADGVPNYFGEQRFGHANLERATAMFEGRVKVKDRNKRGLYLSAARSAMFNGVLTRRVALGNWNHALAGDRMMLDGSHSVFLADVIDEEIVRRVAERDIHPTGPLWGRGELTTGGDVRELEETALAEFGLWRDGLERAGLKQERRALRLGVGDLQAQLEPEQHCVTLSFSLEAGAYATVVLRELINCVNAAKSDS